MMDLDHAWTQGLSSEDRLALTESPTGRWSGDVANRIGSTWLVAVGAVGAAMQYRLAVWGATWVREQALRRWKWEIDRVRVKLSPDGLAARARHREWLDYQPATAAIAA